MSLRIATYNIHRCVGHDGIERPERIAGVLREIDADIIALQEVPSFPAYFPLFGLDRIWVHPAERLLSLRVHATPLSRIASDHLPLVADVDS